MLTLFLIVVVSILFSIFATLNTGLVSFNFGYIVIPNIPIYLAILVPVLLTIVVSLIVHAIRNLSSSLIISNQKNKIKDLRRELAEVVKNNHKLELENAKFKAEVGEPEDANSI
ncbi:MAG: lipopolysaccharide assembly protein LapA domain-containing protein [Microgenomates group bacterium]